MCFSTARSLMNSAFAVAALLRPVASSWSTSLALGEPGQRRAGAGGLAGEQCLDHPRIEDRAAPRHGVEGTHEVVDLGDPFLQQVAEALDPLGESSKA